MRHVRARTWSPGRPTERRHPPAPASPTLPPPGHPAGPRSPSGRPPAGRPRSRASAGREAAVACADVIWAARPGLAAAASPDRERTGARAGRGARRPRPQAAGRGGSRDLGPRRPP